MMMMLMMVMIILVMVHDSDDSSCLRMTATTMMTTVLVIGRFDDVWPVAMVCVHDALTVMMIWAVFELLVLTWLMQDADVGEDVPNDNGDDSDVAGMILILGC